MSNSRDDEPSAFFSRGGQSRNIPGGAYSQRKAGESRPEGNAGSDDEEFHEPNPRNPLIGAKPGIVIGALLSIAGILGLVTLPFLPLVLPSWSTGALVGLVLIGLVVLFLQMPSRRSHNRGDGAQV